jgi:phosphoribosylformimino-5-aminoimidazole carboxamide ribotide isomerase
MNMQLYPAIDLRGGNCVRLHQGDYGQETVYGSDPAAMARHWIDQGATWLHVVDLDGARAGKPVQLDTVAQIVAAAGKVPVQLGGGLREEAHIRQALDAGVSRVILGTRALRDAAWAGAITRAHPGKVVLGLDAREGRVAAQGWLETDSLTVAEVLERAKDWPLAAIVFTDIGRDGTLKGCNVEATAEVARLARVEVIASGGIGSLEDIVAVAKAGLPGCIVGRALYDGRVDLKQAITAVAKA